MTETINFETLKIQDPIESFQSSQSQLDPIDYNLLVNKPDSFLTYYSKGDGSDGNLTVSWTETLVRDMYYDNVTIPVWTSLYTNWFSLCVKGTLINNWIISANGNGWSNASWVTGWAGWVAVNQWTLGINYWWKKWGNWGDYATLPIAHENGVAGDNSNPSYSNVNAVAGASGGNTGWWLLGNGWTAWVATRWVNYNVYLNIAQVLSQLSMPTRNYNVLYNGMPSSGWSGGWQHQGYLTQWGWAGGSWGNGGIIVIHCWTYYWSGTITALGWNGWGWATGANLGGWAGWWGGWGGSGWSGWIIFCTFTIWIAPTTNVSGWTCLLYTSDAADE